MSEPSRRALLLYDATCPLCTGAVAWVMRRAVPGEIAPVSCQSPDRAALAPEVGDEACMQAVQFVAPDGTVYAGAEALPQVFARLRGWRWAARLLAGPGIRWVSPVVYRLIAAHRRQIGRLVGCEDKCGRQEGSGSVGRGLEEKDTRDQED